MTKADSRPRRLNIALSVILIGLALYIIVWPFLPGLTWWIRHDAPVVSGIASPKLKLDTVPVGNTLVIPALNLQEKIWEGNDVSTVHRGVWRRPVTATPPDGSNTVLVGHRFTYSGASVFYHLDKVNVNDEIIVYWEGKPYTYQVYETNVVPPTALEVEAPTEESELTLYTCAPLLTARDRLVVKARQL